LSQKPFEAEIAPYVEALLARKTEAVVALDMRRMSSVADLYLIGSARSHRQVSAIADNAQRFLKKLRLRPLSVEGAREGLWVILDYGHVVIHVFHEPIRALYDLEGLWADAARIDLADILSSPDDIPQGDNGSFDH